MIVARVESNDSRNLLHALTICTQNRIRDQFPNWEPSKAWNSAEGAAPRHPQVMVYLSGYIYRTRVRTNTVILETESLCHVKQGKPLEGPKVITWARNSSGISKFMIFGR